MVRALQGLLGMKKTSDKWNGMNWIRQDKRFALYLRDDCRCVYCLRALGTKGVRMTLDHVVPRSLGGDNAAENLVTACSRCNSRRGNLPVAAFAEVLIEMGADPTAVYGRLKEQLARPVDRRAGKKLVADKKRAKARLAA